MASPRRWAPTKQARRSEEESVSWHARLSRLVPHQRTVLLTVGIGQSPSAGVGSCRQQQLGIPPEELRERLITESLQARIEPLHRVGTALRVRVVARVAVDIG